MRVTGRQGFQNATFDLALPETVDLNSFDTFTNVHCVVLRVHNDHRRTIVNAAYGTAEIYIRVTPGLYVNASWSRALDGRNGAIGTEWSVGVAFHSR